MPFFPTGGNAPVVTLAMRPAVLTGAVAKFETGGTVVSAPSVPAPTAPSPLPGSTPPPAPPPPNVSPTTVQWPGAVAHTAITVVADGGGTPSVLERNGPWSLFRMLEAGSLRSAAIPPPRPYRRGARASLSDQLGLDPESAQSGDSARVPLPEWNLNWHAVRPFRKAAREAGLHRAVCAARILGCVGAMDAGQHFRQSCDPR